MKKSCLAEKLVEKNGLTKKAANEIVNQVFDEITCALKNGEAVELFGFGKFDIKYKEAHMAKNPKTGETVEVAACKTPVFKAAKSLKEIVK